MAISIELPWIDPVLLPNNSDGMPWQALTSSKRTARMIGKSAGLSSGHALDPNQDHPLHVIYFPPKRPGPDSDNLLKAMKHTLDGIAEALGVNDRRFNPITITRGAPQAGGAVRVVIDDFPF